MKKKLEKEARFMHKADVSLATDFNRPKITAFTFVGPPEVQQ